VAPIVVAAGVFPSMMAQPKIPQFHSVELLDANLRNFRKETL